jgi:hypothetical protein
LKHRLSDNVGGVKRFLSVRVRALGEERHFALVEIAVPTKGSLVIVFRFGFSARPMHLFDHLLRS